MMLVCILTSLIISASLLVVPLKFIYLQALQTMYTNLVFVHICRLTVGFVIILTIINSSIWLCIAFKSLSRDDALETSVFVLIFFCINGIAKLFLENQAQKAYTLKKFAKNEINNTEKLLNQMMPPQVLRNLHNDITTTDKYKDVTIIYAELSNATISSRTKEPIQVLTLLSKLFSIFDHLCVRHNVYKVHTIGACYVILSFTDGNSRNPLNESINCIEMGFDMIKAISKINRKKRMFLDIKIGMHTGTVIGGITGTNIVRYDIYGPDNDIANNIQCCGSAGKICISGTTKSFVENACPDRFGYAFNKEVKCPDNRKFNTFFVTPLLEADIVSFQEE